MLSRKTTFLVACLALTCVQAPIRAANITVTRASGSLEDLKSRMAAFSAQFGQAAPADNILVKRDGSLQLIVFNDVGMITTASNSASFVGRHLAGSQSEFVFVSFPAKMELSAQASAVVIGSVSGKRELTGLNGRKVTVPVVSAKAVGIIEGGVFEPNGQLRFALDSPIRIYRLK